MTLYKIIRFHFDADRDFTVFSNLTLEQAQTHCRDSEASSKTCTRPDLVAYTEAQGGWFEGYTEQ